MVLVVSRRFAIFISTFVFCFFVLAGDIEAKRSLPRAAGGSSVGGTSQSATKGATTSVKFRADRLAINVTFKNLSIASSVSYQLTYTGSGIAQGAGGTVSDLTTEPQERELLFGTCSKGVCTYHAGIKNAKFVVTTTLKTGKKVVKTFRLKV